MTISWVAGLLSLPAFAYLFANLLEWASGTQGSSGVFGDTFDGWSAAGLTALVVGGPLIAIAMIVLASLRIRETAREEGSVRATIDVHMARGRLRVAIVSLLLLAATIAYWFNQNWPCTYGNQWTC